VTQELGYILHQRLAARIGERGFVLSRFLQAEQERIARLCFEMARAFHHGGTLIPFGTGGAATDAAHVAVEFMHPVIVGKRALPALAPSNDPSSAAGLRALARADDIALGLIHGNSDPGVSAFLAEASQRGLLTVAFTGALDDATRSALRSQVDHLLSVPSEDPLVVQEVQETTYHVLWELVHVFFEHPGLLDDACITCGDVAVQARVVALHNGSATIEKDGAREDVAVDLVDQVSVGDLLLCHAGVALERLAPEQSMQTPEPQPTAPTPEADDPSGFLYPFLASEEDDLDAVLSDVRASTLRKGSDVTVLRAAIDLDAIESCAAVLRQRLDRGGRLISFGNGGSSTDAQDVACDFLNRGWPAVALTNDPATVTAVGNDVGFDKVFARQLIPLGRAEDIALAISTSGASANVLAGLEEAHRRQMLTCAITGYDGGPLAELDWLDHLFIVRNDYIPRLQEAHATIYHLLLETIGARA
jgi:D-sedoheptulose 7-phosphate isomerase